MSWKEKIETKLEEKFKKTVYEKTPYLTYKEKEKFIKAGKSFQKLIIAIAEALILLHIFIGRIYPKIGYEKTTLTIFVLILIGIKNIIKKKKQQN